MFSDGWYYVVFNSQFPYAIQISNGMIVAYENCDCSTLTTTTTMVPFINECCSAITTTGSDVTVFDFNNDAMSLILPNFTSSYGLAVTFSKLWSIYNTGIKEWDITTSPFSAAYVQEIALPGGFTTTFGITAIDNSTLIAVDTSSSPSEIVELDVSTTTATSVTKITLPTGRVMVSNVLTVKNQDKVVFVNQDTVSSDYYISEYIYSTGLLNVEANIGSVNAVAIIDCACVIYLLTATGDFKILSPGPNYTVIDGAQTGVSLISASQMPTCSNQGLTDPSTTTTTSSSTTTTTTTLSPTCNEYEVSGPIALYYTDCFGQEKVVSVGSGQTENVCASVAIPGATLIGPCPDYTTTTTTTTAISP